MNFKLIICMFLSSLYPLEATGLTGTNPSQVIFDRQFSTGKYFIPIGPFKDGSLESIEIEGTTQKKVFQVKGESPTQTLLDNMWGPLSQLDYEILFHCDTWNCGGFEFRENIDVVESPHMFVNLGDYQFISASNGSATDSKFVTILVSKSQKTGFVQVVFINPPDDEIVEDVEFHFNFTLDNFDSPLQSDFGTKGFTILEGVEFDSGSKDLRENSLSHLEGLADYLKANPDKKFLLVGHTDMEGVLERNIELSAERAHSVRNTLINVLGIDPDQITAHGVGYLSPQETNLTPEGRQSNRRVEVLLLQDFE